MSQLVELLAPAKDLETGIAAITHGADAVYIGASAFGARSEAGNPLEDIRRLCEFAHRYDAKIFLTLNTLLKDDEIERARSLAFDATKAGVDALIVQDMGLLMGPLPDIELHASTQCDIRTPEKAAFLEKAGFSQVVLARELSFDEIRAVHEKLERARIEYFIHGALCVSYSGRCYISEATRRRSANRGECAQLCRLPYTVETTDGRVLHEHGHVLSLKDNNQTANIEALLDAGVRSFKIEGRLKDVEYVKNVTAHYRREIDRVLARRPEFQRASDGVVTTTFEPDPEKSFNRGSTEYFVNGRDYAAPYELAELSTPKSVGKPVARVLEVRQGEIVVRMLDGEELQNGDGLLFMSETEGNAGFRVNEVLESTPKKTRIALRRRTDWIEGLHPGALLRRNFDRDFERALKGESAVRRIPVTMSFIHEAPDGLTLMVSDGRNCVERSVAMELSEARNRERNLETIRKNLSRLGDTRFEVESLFVPDDFEWFVPASLANELRREAIAALEEEREKNRRRTHRPSVDETAVYPELLEDGSLDYTANVGNALARKFYEMHGARRVGRAFEIAPVADAALMTCRHCVRAMLKLCPKMLKHHPEWLETTDRALFRPEDLVLRADNGRDVFVAKFHCRRKPCEMTLHAPDANGNDEDAAR